MKRTTIYDPASFDFVPAVCWYWKEVLAEYENVSGALRPWHERDLHDGGWKVFGLFDFPNGEAMAENVKRCPVTARLVEEHFPKHGAAGFSVLGPGTHIKTHVGYQGNFLRCHLGLKVPKGECILRVGDTHTFWKQGECVVFDDRVEHEAWNRTRYERVVLLVDFVP